MTNDIASSPQPDSSRPTQAKAWGDYQIEVVVGYLLRYGVIFSAMIVFCGGCIYLFRHAHELADYRMFRGEPSDLRTIPGVLQSAEHDHGRGWIQLGLLFLIATPTARVAFAVVGFALERDRMYVTFTLIVLLVLLYSLIGSGLTF